MTLVATAFKSDVDLRRKFEYELRPSLYSQLWNLGWDWRLISDEDRCA